MTDIPDNETSAMRPPLHQGNSQTEFVASIRRVMLALAAQTPADVAGLVVAVSEEKATDIADAFYLEMTEEEQTRKYLPPGRVEATLRNAMHRWIVSVFSPMTNANVDASIRMQCEVGAAHSRIGIRVEFIIRGARIVRREMFRHLAGTGASEAVRTQAIALCSELIDLSIEVMSAQYSISTEIATRTDEAYRTFAISMNMALEREKQRAALLDWQNQLLQHIMVSRETPEALHIKDSSFGLWIKHKGSMIFEMYSEIDEIRQVMREIDERIEDIRAASAEQDHRRQLVSISSATGKVKTLLNALFDNVVDIESGRDPLTHLLNRRFMPSLLSREIDIYRHSGQVFSLLLIDVDHFKQVNDLHGHDAGDAILQALARILIGAVRGSDFVFRYGGEEFMVLCVETASADALLIAEEIRKTVMSEKIALREGNTLEVTVSIGISTFDGNPDYTKLLGKADRALYSAKKSGRNCCILAD